MGRVASGLITQDVVSTPPWRLPDPRGPLVAAVVAAMVASVATIVPTLLPDTVADDADAAAASAVAAVAATTDSASQFVQAGEVPAGLTTDEWTSIQRQIAAAEAIEVIPASVSRTPAPVTSSHSPQLSSALGVATFSPGAAVIPSVAVGEFVTLRTTDVGSVAVALTPGTTIGDRVEFVHSPTITEWYRELPEGLQQGFTLAAPVTADATTVVRVDVGPATPSLIDPQTIEIRTPVGERLLYRDLAAWGADGTILDSVMGVVDGTITLSVDTVGAVYPVTIDPTIVSEARLLPTPDAAGDRFGEAIALDDASGDMILVVGALGDDDQGSETGSAQVFRDSGAGFELEATLLAPSPGDIGFGWDVDVRGEVVVVGAPGDDANGNDAGAVFVFEPTGGGGAWEQTGTVYQCDATVSSPCGAAPDVGSGFAGAQFGFAVDLTDQFLVVGAPGFDSSTGTASLYLPNGNDWETTTARRLTGEELVTGDQFGYAVSGADAGTHVVVGSPGDDNFNGTDAGAGYYQQWDGDSLSAPASVIVGGINNDSGNTGAAVSVDVDADGDAFIHYGAPVNTRFDDGTQPGASHMWRYALPFGADPVVANFLSYGSASFGDGQGRSVDFTGDQVVFGTYLSDESGTDAGSGRRFPFISSTNLYGTGLTPALPASAGDRWGFDVAAQGDVYIFSGPGNDTSGLDSGQIYVGSFTGSFTPYTIDPKLDNADDRFGWAIDIDGDRLAVSAINDDASGVADAGGVYMFARNDAASPWVGDGVIVSPDPETEGRFGDSVAVIGDRVAIGESDRFGDQAENGRVFVFDRAAPATWTQVGTEIFSQTVNWDAFGASVAWQDTNTLVVGAPAEGFATGAVFQVTFAGPDWNAPTLLSTPLGSTGDQIGYSVAVSEESPGNWVIVAGAPGHDGGLDATPDSGAIHIYQDDGGGANHVQTVQTGTGWGAGDRMGTSAASDRGYLAVAGMADETGGADLQAYLLEDQGSGFLIIGTFVGTLPTPVSGEPGANDYVDLVGRNLFLGHPGSGGQVQIFRDVDGNGFPAAPVDVYDPTGSVPGDSVGFSTSVDDRSIAAGAPGYTADSGTVYPNRSIPLSHTFVGTAPAALTDPESWDTGVTPGPLDTIVIPASTGLVIVGGTLAVGRLVLGAGSTIAILESETLTIQGDGITDPTVVSGTLLNTSSSTLNISTDVVISSGGRITTEEGKTTNLTAQGTNISITGGGRWVQEGTLNKVGDGIASIGSGISWQSATTSVINVDTGILEMGVTTYPEDGDISVGPGARIEFADNLLLGATSTVDIEINGPSSTPGTFGVLEGLGSPSFSSATLTSTLQLGYSPTAADVYPVIECGFCEAFGTTSVLPFDATVNASDITLALTGPCDTHWTNGFGDNTWSTAANWSAGVPTATSVVCMDVPGTDAVLITDDSDVGRFETSLEDLNITSLSSLTVHESSFIDGAVTIRGTLTGIVDVILNGGGSLISGTITGLVSIPNAVDFSISDGTIDGTGGGNFINDGNLTVTGAFVELVNGASVENNGTWTWDSAAVQELRGGVSSGTFTNAGSFVRTGSGTLNVLASATFDVDPGGFLHLENGFVNWFAGGTWAGPVTVQVDTGTELNWDGAQSISGLVEGQLGDGSPGKVVLRGTKTSAGGATLTFPEDSDDPGVAAGYALSFDAPVLQGDTWTIDGFARLVDVSPATSTSFVADTTITPGGTLSVEDNFSNAGNLVNQGVVVALAEQFGGAGGTFTNEGLVQFARTATFTSVNSTWIGASTGVVEFLPFSLTDMQDVGVESGRVVVHPSTFTNYSNTPTLGAGSRVEIVILGPSFSSANHGRLTFDNSPTLDPAATLAATIVGYTPTATDAYTVATCSSGACAQWPLTDTAPLRQTDVAGNVVLTLAPDIPGRIFAPDPDGLDGFGQSVAIHEDWMVVGAPLSGTSLPDTGTAYVFRRTSNGDDWTFVVELEADDATVDQAFGTSVAMAGTRFDNDGDDGNFVIAVGAPATQLGASDGDVYLFRYDFFTDDWVQTRKVSAPVGAIDFGYDVALEQRSAAFRNGGYALVVGAPAITGAEQPGAAYLYRYTITENPAFSDAVSAPIDVETPDPVEDGRHGISVAVDADTIVVGEAVGGSSVGQAHVYRYDLGAETATFEATLRQPVADETADDDFGLTVDVDGDLVVVGSDSDQTGGAPEGAAYAFSRTGTTWGAGEALLPDGPFPAGFGLDVAVQDGVVAVSSSDGGTGDAGTVHVFGFDPSDGWVAGTPFEWTGGTPTTTMGVSLALGEDGVLVVGTADDDNAGGENAGAVQAFSVGLPLAPNQVTTAQDLDAAQFGWDVDVDGEWAIIAAPGAGATEEGSAFMFRRVAGEWTLFQELIDQFTPIDSTDDYGIAVAVGGNWAAIADERDFVFPYFFDGSSWNSVNDISLADATTFVDLAIDGATSRLIIGEGRIGAVTGDARIYQLSPGGHTQETVFEPINATNSLYGRSVAISGDTAFVAAERDNANDGSVAVLQRSPAGEWSSSQVLMSPAGSVGQLFGADIDASDGRLIASQPGTTAWIFEDDGSGTWSDAAQLSGAPGVNSVTIDGDIAAVGATRGSTSDPVPGVATIFARAGSTWVETDQVTAAANEFGDAFGFALAVDGSSLLVGSPFDSNIDGVVAGSGFFFDVTTPDNPTLSFTLGLQVGQPTPTVAGGTGIPISQVSNAAPLIERRGGTSGGIGATALDATGVADSALAGTLLGETPFGAIAVSNDELANLPILSIGLDLANGDDWPQILDTPEFTDRPIVNITVGEVFGSTDPTLRNTIDAIPFGAIDVGGTPFGAIPFGAIALGGVPLTLIPPGPDASTPAEIEAAWCDVLAGTSEACVNDVLDPGATLLSISLSDVPFGAIPFGAIPFGAIPVEQAPFGAILLEDVRVQDTPFGAIPFGAIPFGAIDINASPFGAIPFGAIPFGAIPFGAIDLDSTPFGAIDVGTVPFGAIDVNGAPFGAIPFGAIALADVNLADIPLDPDRTAPAEIEADWCALMIEFGLDCENPVTSVSTTTVTDLGVRGIPFGAIPFGAIPFGAIPFGAIDLNAIPFGAIPFGAIPFGAINLNAVDINDIDLAGTPFGAIPFGAIPFGAISTSVGAIPFGAIDVQGSPFGAIRLEDIDTDATPFGAIPFGAIPFGAISPDSVPFGAIPFGAIPFGAIGPGADVGAIPFGAIDLVDSPFGAIPFGAIPFGAIGSIVDCDAIDCDGNSTLRDAFLAGAIRPGATLADLGSAADNFRLPDLAEHLLGIDSQELYDAVAAWGVGRSLADLTDFANMTLADLPADNALFRRTVLNDVKAGLSRVTFEDLALALLISNVADPAGELEIVVDEFGDGLSLAQFATFGDTTFSELLPAFAGGQLGDLGAFLAFIHLGELGIDPAIIANALATGGTGTNGAWLVRDAVNDPALGLGDMKLADVVGNADWGAATVLDLVNSLPDGEVAGFTFSDLLLGMLPPGALPWGLAFEKIDAKAIPGVMPAITLQGDFALTGTRPRSVEVSVELPTNAAYQAGTTVVSPPVNGDLEPAEVDGRLVWTFAGVKPGPDQATPGATYTMTFDVQPTLAVGLTTVNADSRIVGAPSSIAATTQLRVLEAFEPNDVPAQAVDVAEDVIYLVHIPDEDDVDLFTVNVLENDALAVDLSGLPADFDVVVYRETTAPASSTALTRTTGGDPLIPLLDPDADGSETVPDQSFPRFDLGDSNLSLVEVSNSRGRAKETVVTDRLPAGRYVIQIHGHDGANSAEPAVLQINIIEAGVVPECSVRGPLPSATPGAGLNLANLPADLNTVILLNEMRFEQIYGSAGRAAVTTSLAELVTAMGSDPEISTLGLSAIVVPVDGSAAVRDAYDFWDDPAANGGIQEDACDPSTANSIVSTIVTELLDPIRDVRDIDNIVLVGSDDLLPFGRLDDATQTANEFDYRNDLRGRNAFTGTFWSSSFLSDDPYADTAALPYGDRFLYVPDAALGRVLESPTQIVDQIEQFITFDGFLAADTGLIAGYDFLVDGSEAITDELRDNGAVPIVDDELADGLNAAGAPWTAADFGSALLDGVPAGENGFDLVSFNAHFDHYRALPAAGDGVTNFNANFESSSISSLSPTDARLDGTIIFSMGCHSGLNVPNLGVGITGVTEDWAEVFTEQRAIYIGNTGFGYGDTETVGYTERLMQLFARNVASPIAGDLADPSSFTSIGDAMRFAKQEAFSEMADVSVYHEKAYQESTFYGLPFFRVGVAPELAPPPPDNQPEIDELTGSPTVSFLAQPQNTPNVVETVDGGVVVKTETYYSNLNGAGDPVTITQPGRPIQPALSIDVTDVDPADPSSIELEARGAIILDMTSTYVSVDPVLSVPVFDESTQASEPRRDDIVYPTVPHRVSTFERPDGTRQNLVLATGQYRGTETLGAQRLDDDIDLVVYYADPNEPDRSAPRILSVDTGLDGPELSISARVDDTTGVDRVYVLVTPSPNLAQADWFGVDLVDVGDGQWVGGITFATNPDEIELLVQAKDEAGNVGVSTNKAKNFGDETLPPPPVSTLASTLTADPAGPLVNGFYTGPVTVTADAGGTPIGYRLNSTGPFLDLDLENGVVVTGDRAHKIELLAIDGQRATRTFKIDTLSPTVTITKPVNQAAYVEGQVVKSSFQCRDSSGAACAGVVRRNGAVVANLASGQNLPTAAAGTYELTVTATDPVGRTTSAIRAYSVASPSASPEIVTISVPQTPQLITDGVVVGVEFTDQDGAADSYSVTIDFGDADPDDPSSVSTTCTVTTAAPVVTGGAGEPSCELTQGPDAGTGALGIVTSNFVYPRPGVFLVGSTVVDAVGNLAQLVADDFVVVFDPQAGRVTGSGKFWSDDSSYVDADDHGEWAYFGYRARYKKQNPVPIGRTKLKLKGDFNFTSTSYDYLIINDTMAVAEGLGKLDGVPGYRFRVQGVDNGSTDFFQITIWEDADPENIIYDNGVIFDENGQSEGDEVLAGGIKIKP